MELGTDMPLLGIIVANREVVQQQVDGVNCGVLTCVYAERLARGIPRNKKSQHNHFFDLRGYKLTNAVEMALL
ncbi:unnamed protein product [Strongylus vulgaris]|uniref:Uncharacterized protein n=1 Tax=Strongylus vulgaris TaxID=40348 RepID=A0A3P7J735_STRVU|nr:unnamed protein product [Strongylus vulgaris]